MLPRCHPLAGQRRHSEIRCARVQRASRCGSELALSRIVKHAELVRTESLDAAFDLLRGGNVEAFASARRDLVKYSGQMPGSQVLADRYGGSFSAIAVPK